MENDISRPLMLFDLVPPPWRDTLTDEVERINDIGRELARRADSGERILPDRAHVFRALEIPPESVKILIIGQDPYPNASDACGLAFSVKSRNSGLPGSLLNIQKEIITDIGSTTTSDGDLSRWADQGVMLLNRVLTVRAGDSGSHGDLGWQKVTEKIARKLAELDRIAILWGNTAKELAGLFPPENVITGVHPSPLSAHRGFLGSKPFSKANEMLKSKNLPTINW